MTTPIATSAPASAPELPPAIESGGHSFIKGWLLTTRDALRAPKRFYGQLSEGPLGLPFVYAAVSLALPLIAADLAGYAASNEAEAHGVTALGLIRSSLSPLFGAALILAIQGLLWTGVTRAFGAKVPLSVALRATAFMTSIAATFGVVMTLTGFAPESAFCVIVWYASLNISYLFATYATYCLARGQRYSFGPIKAGFVVWLFQIACGFVLVLALFGWAQIKGGK